MRARPQSAVSCTISLERVGAPLRHHSTFSNKSRTIKTSLTPALTSQATAPPQSEGATQSNQRGWRQILQLKLKISAAPRGMLLGRHVAIAELAGGRGGEAVGLLAVVVEQVFDATDAPITSWSGAIYAIFMR